MDKKLTVLFVCTHNACRSQMAEGWARHLKGDVIEAQSAGSEPGGLDPRAIAVMAEAGVDISHQRSKQMDELRGAEFDYVITLWGYAEPECPTYPARPGTVIHIGFDDPPRLAQGAPTDEQALRHYRRVRDEIRDLVQSLPEAFPHAPGTGRCCGGHGGDGRPTSGR